MAVRWPLAKLLGFGPVRRVWARLPKQSSLSNLHAPHSQSIRKCNYRTAVAKCLSCTTPQLTMLQALMMHRNSNRCRACEKVWLELGRDAGPQLVGAQVIGAGAEAPVARLPTSNACLTGNEPPQDQLFAALRDCNPSVAFPCNTLHPPDVFPIR